jgi:hypothetical protein
LIGDLNDLITIDCKSIQEKLRRVEKNFAGFFSKKKPRKVPM